MEQVWQDVIIETRNIDDEWRIETIEHTEVNTSIQYKSYHLYEGNKSRGIFETKEDSWNCYFVIKEIYEEIKRENKKDF